MEDNDADRAIDCADPKCMGSVLCTHLADGDECLLDGQCAGGLCRSESITTSRRHSTSARIAASRSASAAHGGASGTSKTFRKT